MFVRAEGTNRLSCAVKVNSKFVRKVRVRAFNPFALEGELACRIVEALEPHGTGVGRQGPLTKPYGVLDPAGLGHDQVESL